MVPGTLLCIIHCPPKNLSRLRWRRLSSEASIICTIGNNEKANYKPPPRWKTRRREYTISIARKWYIKLYGFQLSKRKWFEYGLLEFNSICNEIDLFVTVQAFYKQNSIREDTLAMFTVSFKHNCKWIVYATVSLFTIPFDSRYSYIQVIVNLDSWYSYIQVRVNKDSLYS
jgi:hypothetical protein